MKALKFMAVMLLVAFTAAPTQAQILKKLGKKAEKAAERTILNRADHETSKSTDRALDSVLDVGKNKKGKVGEGSGKIAPEFKFSYKATMKITSNKKDAWNLVYWLQPDSLYFASESPTDKSERIINVMDLENLNMIMYMSKNGGNKTAMNMPLSKKMLENLQEDSQDYMNDNEAKISELGTKTILGYECTGYQIDDKKGTSKTWFTHDLPISYLGASENPNVSINAIPNVKGAWIMEMEYTSKKKQKENMHMVCTEIKKEKMSIKTSEYEFTGF